MTRGAAATALLVALSIADAGAQPLEARARQAVQAWIADRHVDAHDVDKSKVIQELVASAPAGETDAALRVRATAALERSFFDFAPSGARPDPSVRYRLPFELDVPRYLAQGVDGKHGHDGWQRFAFDFAMPTGTRVLAARDGIVVRVIDGFKDGGLDPRFADHANLVFVLHDDGTFAGYLHLRAGIPVKRGQRVKQGDPIAWSDHTGFSAGPHLHFAVHRRNESGAVETIPIRFGVGSPAGFVPREGEFYGGRPRRNVELRVTAGGEPLDADHPLHLAVGASTVLAVSLAPPAGAPVDVTRSPFTHFLAPTAWSVTVDAHGRVTAAPTPDYAKVAGIGNVRWGVVIVSHEDASGDRFGFTSVPVVIDDAKH